MALTFQYKWLRDGNPINGATSPNYVVTNADQGHTLTFEVYGINGYGATVAISLPFVIPAGTITPTAPVNTIAPVINQALIGSSSTSTTGTWTGTTPITFAYQWQANGSNVGTNSPNYTPVSGDNGKTLTCIVTASNSVGSASQVSNSLTVSTGTGTPVNTVAPSINYATIGHFATCRKGTWTGNFPLQYHYQWQTNGSNVGTDNPTYMVQAGDNAKALTCIVTVINGVGSTSQVSNSLTAGTVTWTSLANAAAFNAIIAAGPTVPTNYMLASGNFGDINAFNKDFRSAPIRISGQLDGSTIATGFEQNCTGITFENITFGAGTGVTPIIVLDDNGWPMTNIYNNFVINTGTPFGTQAGDGWVVYCPSVAGGDVIINGRGNNSLLDIYGVGEGMQLVGNATDAGRILVNNMTIDNVEDNGIIGNDPQNVTINAVLVTGVYSTGGDHPDGIQFGDEIQSVNNLTITNCGVQRGNGTGAGTQGYFLQGCNNVFLQNNWFYDDTHSNGISSSAGSEQVFDNNFCQGFTSTGVIGDLITRGGVVDSINTNNSVSTLTNWSGEGVNPGYQPASPPGSNTIIPFVASYGDYSHFDTWKALHPTARDRNA